MSIDRAETETIQEQDFGSAFTDVEQMTDFLASARARLLIVSQDPDVRTYMRRLLGGTCEVESAADGEAALRAMHAARPDLVLADVMTPPLDTFGFIRAIRNDPELQDLSVIMLSVPGEGKSRVAGRAPGAEEFLVKPLSSRALITRVFANLQLSATRRRDRRKQSGQKRVLEMVATGGPLQETLTALMLLIEELEPALHSNILLVSEDGSHLRRCSGPHMPEQFHCAVDGSSIFPPYVGTCSEAAHRGVTIVSKDLAREARYAPEWCDLMVACGVRAVRSTPVFGAEGEVLASIAICFDHPCEAKPTDPDLLDMATHLAAIAIEHQKTETALRRREAWLAGEKEAFQAAVNGAPLATSLGVLAKLAVAQTSGECRCGFYLADAARKGLHHVVGMPEGYARAVDGFAIGPKSLACGLAICRGEPVITRDVHDEPRWKPWLWMAEKFGFRGCWSFPVQTAEGKAVGTFAMYFPGPREPTPADSELAATLVHTASIIISRHQEAEERARVTRALLRSEENVAAELAAMQELQRVSVEMIGEQNARSLYEKIVRAAAAIMHADSANMQVLHPEADRAGELQLLITYGDAPACLNFPECSRSGAGCTCARAMRAKKRTIACDVRTWNFLAGSEDRARYLEAGILAAQSTPLVTRSGRVVGVLSTHWHAPHEPTERELRLLDVLARQAADLIERKETERGLREAQENLTAALDASGTGTFRWDPETGEFLAFDDGLKRLFDFAPEEPVRRIEDILDKVHPEDRPKVTAALEACRAGVNLEIECRLLLRDGTTRWIYARAKTTPKAEDVATDLVGACMDITERKHGEERRELLIAELNHRVKNTLATVQSFAVQSLKSAASLDEGRGAFSARLIALSKAHNVLVREQWEAAELREIAAEALAAYAGKVGTGRRVTYGGDDIRIQPKAALAISMALHELSTNAVKYGALSNACGRVDVRWRLVGSEKDEFVLDWRESGGPPVVPPKRHGFGSRLIERGLAQDLAGEARLEFQSEGLLCSIRAPLAEVAQRRRRAAEQRKSAA